MHQVIPLFNFPLYVSYAENLDIFYLKNQADKANYVDPAGEISVQSSDENILSKLPNLENIIRTHVDEYLYNVLSVKKSFEYIISDCCFVRVEPDGGSNLHFHSNSLFSGVIYISVSNKSNITFSLFERTPSCTVKYNLPFKSYNVSNCLNWTVEVEDKQVLIFPAGLYHKVNKNMSNERRYSIAFNIMPYNYSFQWPGQRINY